MTFLPRSREKERERGRGGERMFCSEARNVSETLLVCESTNYSRLAQVRPETLARHDGP